MHRFVLAILFFGLLSSVAAGQTAPDSGDVIVNEVMYAPSPASNEFIELYNRSDSPINVRDLEYADANRNYSRAAPADTLLPSKEYIVLVRDSSAFESAFPGTNSVTPPGWDALNNGGDTVLLRHVPSGTVLDSVPYDPSWGGDDGSSLERIDPAGPSDRAQNFSSSDADEGGTPATQNSQYAPDTTPPILEAARSVPSADSVIVTFSEPVARSTVSSQHFELTPHTAPGITSASRSDTATSTVHCQLASSLSEDQYSIVARDVADQRGNVQSETDASFRYFVPEVPDSGDVVINEILYAPSPPSNEFIEIYNRSTKTLDLGHLSYSDANRAFTGIAKPMTALPPDAYAVIVRDAEAFENVFTNVQYRAPSGWDALNNGGDRVVLQHGPSSTVIDAVPYRPTWADLDGQSLERIDPAGPSDAPTNFAASTARKGATPGRMNSRHNPDERPPFPTFAEQASPRTAEITFSEPLDSSSVDASAFTIKSTRVMEAKLLRDSVAVLSLAGPPDATIRIEGVRDQVGNVLESAVSPLALQPESEAILVNEILFDPRTDEYDGRPDQVEYIELRNQTPSPRTLKGLVLTDRPDENGRADTLRLERPLALPPKGYGVVAAAPNDPATPSASQLVHAFPDAPVSADSVAFVPISTSRLGLGNEGDLVRVHRSDGTQLTEVPYRPEWHADGLEETKGTALERISPTGRSTAADNWTSSPDSAGGTPGARNAVSLSPTNPSESGLTVTPSPFSIERDGATRIQFTLDGVPNLVRARIYDARGRHVRTLEDAQLTGASGELVWNGRDNDGNRVRIGVYIVLFEAVRAKEGTVQQFKSPVVVARPFK